MLFVFILQCWRNPDIQHTQPELPGQLVHGQARRKGPTSTLCTAAGEGHHFHWIGPYPHLV